MELELNLTHLNHYETILEDTISQEKTMEAIVPDACPDILRIVDTEGAVLLTGKEIKEGRAEISGVVKATVIYVSDEIEGLRRLEVTIPFTCAAERPDIRPPCRLVSNPRMRGADTRMLNPRKILVRADLIVPVKVFAPKISNVGSGVESGQEMGIQQRRVNQDAFLVTALQEKPFSFSDELDISASKPGAEELLKSNANLWCSESKIIGNKLIVKGEVNLQILYRTADNDMGTAQFMLPFSQIMEVAGVQEDAESAVDVVLTDLICELTGSNDGRTIAVTLGLLAQAVVREVRRIELLCDLYSTVYELSPELKQYEFNQLNTAGTSRQNIREQMESELPVNSVADIGINIGQLEQSRHGGEVRLSAEAAVRILYVAEDGSIRAALRRMPVTHQLDLPPNSNCSFDCNIAGDWAAMPVSGGIEVRFSVDFRFLALSSRRVAGVSSVNLDENAVRDNANEPSVVLRMVEHEELWDLAKAYATTTGEIMQANALMEEEVPHGRLLLIPKKR